MTTAYIGMGSNLNFNGLAPVQLLDQSCEHLKHAGRIVARSSTYLTSPVGFAAQAVFHNAVIALDTTLEPLPLLQLLLATERHLGRIRTADQKNGPRTLDLDLLLYGDVQLHTHQLVLPHPRLADRRFVLAPLAEIAPELVHPALQQTMQQLLDQLPRSGENGFDAVRRAPAADKVS